MAAVEVQVVEVQVVAEAQVVVPIPVDIATIIITIMGTIITEAALVRLESFSLH